MIKELGGEMSGGSSALFSFSTGITAGRYTMFFVIAVIIITAVSLIHGKTERGKAFYGKFFSSFVFTKPIMKKIVAYRFSSAMSLLLSSGMNVDKSMDLLLEIVDDKELKNKIEACSKSMKEGDNFIDALSKLSVFSGMHIQMLNMGQRTGEMDNVMNKLTKIYENEADQAISSTVALVEPVLVGILSIAIGAILISVMLPLMNIMSSIG